MIWRSGGSAAISSAFPPTARNVTNVSVTLGMLRCFWRTGTYNADIAAFTHHFLRNIVDEQLPSGAFTNTAPGVPQRNLREGSPGWVDAGVIIPWTAWTQYGDTGVIEANWEAMERFMAYVLAINPEYIRRKGGSQLGDWLNMRAPTPPDLIATGFWALDAEMMAQMATATGREAAATKYRDLGTKLREAFQKAFIKEDGTIGSGSQASYVFAFAAGMVPDPLKATAIENLVKAIEERGLAFEHRFSCEPLSAFGVDRKWPGGRGVSPPAQRNLSLLGLHDPAGGDDVVGALEFGFLRRCDELV